MKLKPKNTTIREQDPVREYSRIFANDEKWMREALDEATKGYECGEIPIGAVLVQNDQIIARNFNQREKTKNPLHHAEILVLEEGAKKIGTWRLSEVTLYVTLEPCPMCLGALLQARVGRLVYGCLDPKRFQESGNFSFPTLKDHLSLSGNNHTVTISGPVLEEDCSQILKKFFKERRKK